MEGQRLLSVGIDIGTSTTQCTFSSLRLHNTAPAFALPRIAITDKEVLYRAPLRLTPLLDADTIDAAAVRALIEGDYRAAGIQPAQIGCGAVIITGETAHKRNARAVTEALSGFAGEFVVATAGPDMEAMLAGKGAGAAQLSRERGKRVLNLDIGGGTTNICLFEGGEPVAAGCMDIGGRLLRFDKATGRVRYAAEKLLCVARDVNIDATVGQALSAGEIKRIAERCAVLLEEAVGLAPRTPLHDVIMTEHDLPRGLRADLYTFSGGVAACLYGEAEDGLFDDMGVALGAALARSRFFEEGRVLRPKETVNATVIGAGAYSMNVSGSTVSYDQVAFPITGLPVARVPLTTQADIAGLRAAVAAQRASLGDRCAIGFEGLRQPSFQAIEQVAQALADALEDVACPVIVMTADIAKALGQAIARRRGDRPLLCIDGVSLSHGDLIDIGAPLLSGRVLPVVVKTLAFS